MAELRKKGEQTRYRVIDSDCIGRACFQPGIYQHRGATGASGSRNTGQTTACCMRNAYHGCPDERPIDIELKRQRIRDGWKTT